MCVKVGIIGCGAISKARHIPEYSANKNVKIVGYYDYYEDRAKEFADIYGGKVYPTYEELLSDKEIAAVSVCTANEFHGDISIAALEKGKHVLCEKPMANTLEECERMIAAQKKSNKILMIAQNQRFTYGHEKAKELLEKGEIGDILTFQSTLAHPGPEYWSVNKSTDTWYYKKTETNLGAVADLGIHKADLLRYLLGEEIVEVSSYVTTLDKKYPNGKPVEVSDNAVSIMKTESGKIGNLLVSYTNYGKWNSSTILYGTKGVMKLFMDDKYLVIIEKKGCETIKYSPEGERNSRILDSFVDSILRKNEPKVSGFDGLMAMKIILGFTESSKQGKKIKITR